MPGWQINLIILALALGFSGITWVLRQLQEQAAKAAAQRERERRKLEYLRTGRDPGEEETIRAPAGPADAQARLRELAQRRQAQLKNLREQKGGTAEPAAAKPEGTVRVEMWPGGPVLEVGSGGTPTLSPGRAPAPAPRTATPRPASPRPAPARTGQTMRPPTPPTMAPRAPMRPSPRPGSMTAAPSQEVFRAPEGRTGAPPASRSAVPGVRSSVAGARDKARAKKVVPDEPESVRTPTVVDTSGDARADEPITYDLPDSLDRWRAALIAGEILGRPVGLRGQEHLPGL